MKAEVFTHNREGKEQWKSHGFFFVNKNRELDATDHDSHVLLNLAGESARDRKGKSHDPSDDPEGFIRALPDMYNNSTFIHIELKDDVPEQRTLFDNDAAKSNNPLPRPASTGPCRPRAWGGVARVSATGWGCFSYWTHLERRRVGTEEERRKRWRTERSRDSAWRCAIPVSC